MVGGGIFAVLGVAATDAGGGTPLAFALGGAVAAVTAYSHSKLSVAMPSAGGTVTFVDRVYRGGWLTGSLNATLWVGYVATIALYTSAFGHYTATLFPGGTNPSGVLLRTLMIVGVAVPWLINMANASLIARTEGFVVGIKLLMLGVVVVAGMPAISTTKLAPASWPSPIGVLTAGMLIFVAYEGFELIANASEDVRDARRTLPRAFALSVGLVIVLYVAIAAVVVGSLSTKEIASSADFALAQAASASLGSAGFRLVAVSAMLATLSAINATLYGASRLSYTLAREGELPERFEHLRWNSPDGLHITAFLGLILAVGLPLSSISTVASAVFLGVFAVVNAAAAKASADIGASKLLSQVGSVGCLLSLVVLIGRSASQDRAALVVLATLVVAALSVERWLLAKHRGRSPTAPRTRIGCGPSELVLTGCWGSRAGGPQRSGTATGARAGGRPGSG